MYPFPEQKKDKIFNENEFLKSINQQIINITQNNSLSLKEEEPQSKI